MARNHYLAKAKTKARKDGNKDILNYLKDLGHTNASCPEQLNNYCVDYVLNTKHYNGYQELQRRAEVHISGKDVAVANCKQVRISA